LSHDSDWHWRSNPESISSAEVLHLQSPDLAIEQRQNSAVVDWFVVAVGTVAEVVVEFDSAVIVIPIEIDHYCYYDQLI